MPRKIADIKKELDLKRKTAAKTEETIEGMEERVKEAAKKISDLRPKIDDLRKIIVLNEKALKDPKTKKENRPGLTKQMEEAEKKVLPMEKSMEDATEEYDATKKRIEILKKSDAPIQKKIEELEKELAEAEKGVKEFGESREEFLEWYEGQLKKLKTYVDHIAKAAVHADRQRGGVVMEIKAGNLQKAAEYAANSRKGADIATKTSQLFDKLRVELVKKKDTQRNLAPAAFNTTLDDVKVHEAVTKKVYALFGQEDRWMSEVKVNTEDAQESAEEAETWLKAGTHDVKGFAVVLVKSLDAVRKMVSDVRLITDVKWGQIIMLEGKRIKEEADLYRKEPEKRKAVALKTLEQASAMVPETVNRVRIGVGRITASCKKSTASVPREWTTELSGQLDQFATISDEQEELLKLFIAKSEKTNVEIEKLRDLVGA